MEEDILPSTSRNLRPGLPPEWANQGARPKSGTRRHQYQTNRPNGKNAVNNFSSPRTQQNRQNGPEFGVQERLRQAQAQGKGILEPTLAGYRVTGYANKPSHGQQREGINRKFNDRTRRLPQFATLQDLANCDDKDILGKISEKQLFFFNLFKSPIVLNKPDIFILIFKILAKVCRSSYDDLKLKLLINVCNESFVVHLRNYLSDLPDGVKSRNSLYWNNQNEFWQNFITFCTTIINLSPSIALKMYRPLIYKTSNKCLEELNEQNAFKLSAEDTLKLIELQERLTQYENQNENNKTQAIRIVDEAVGEPPEQFRELPIIPDHHYLMRRPYLRPNIVEGQYQDVEHYLDVQFRLLQEDCYGPLRKGILQYLEDPGRGKFDNIRVYKNIKFRGPYVSESKVGIIVAVDNRSNKRFFKINWATSKRLLYGSLLVLSKDNFKRFIVATVLDREEKLLQRGLLPICIVNNDYDGDLSIAESYTLIESEVYFEPYYHVLKVLQSQRFPQHLAMQDYIVKAQPLTNPPQYLTDNTQYTITVKDYMKNVTNILKFNVLKEETWPSADELCLNESQYRAYKLALTHEFTVIQGPPGTGKTYIGTKIAQTLLQSSRHSMLVVCYTNHALDQFLETILSFTKSIARVGSRSKNKAMEDISLQKWRREIRRLPSYSLYQNEKDNFKRIVNAMKRLQEYINSLDTGLLDYSSITQFVPDSKILAKVYDNCQSDIITEWLFERMPRANFVMVEEEPNSAYGDVDNTERARVQLEDDLEDDADFELDDEISLQMSFKLENAHSQLKSLIAKCRNNPKPENTIKWQMELEILNSKIQFFKAMKNLYTDDGREYILRGKNVARMKNEERWATYFSWTKVIQNHIQNKFNQLYLQYETNNKSYEDARMNWDREVLEHVRVIGMTTTGAARLQKTIQELKPAIVIVEEAAEVLEQHIISSLTSNCKHLILIGDHQQLRPSAAYMKLARDYNIEVSLFERMIRNKVANQRLNVQHRMRPEIASLIVPHIYQDLVNHPHVQNKPHVRGVLRNVFFLSHNFFEQEADEGSSRTNENEADIALGLANYLIQQDYTPEDITILTAYSGQMFYMRKQRKLYRHLSNVKITVVDNYQGEESKIIILSLVRNNLENKIGFLSTENRVCVALSRAKEGFFILGNMDILRKNSELWEKIAITLENMESLGTSMKLKCEIHPTQITTIETVKDFDNVPEGGCLLKCGYVLDCKHLCPQLCHTYDRAHASIACTEKCERILCERNHVCPKMCKIKCDPCMVPIEKRLPCDHDMYLPCHQKPDDKEKVKCLFNVDVTLPHCGHRMRKQCYKDVREVKCIFKCEFRVQTCGHVCMLMCHVTDDPDHEKYLCGKPCAKAKKNCTADLLGDRGQHQCPKMCYETCDNCTVEVKKKRSSCKHSEVVACHENVDDKPCLKKCARNLPCGHFCLKKCFELCGDCSIKVTKPIPECKHEVKIECGRSPQREDCTAACERTLPCGHVCAARCAEPCAASACAASSDIAVPAPCGHRVALPCNIASQWSRLPTEDRNKVLLKHCAAPCNQTLKCDHVCSGTCSQCFQGRIHMPCTQTCQKINICGHSCEEPCNQICPPCKKPCELSCDHSKCNRVCGSPCTPCQEKCTRACEHGACVNRCGEACSRRACDRPCGRALRCGHPCRGLCGELCPDVCRLCRPDTFPKDFLGYDFDEDARFIQLQDCPHILEVDDMDCLMTGDTATISVRACPFCRKSIISTRRYKDLINHQFNTDINLIKRKIFGDQNMINNLKKECEEAILKLPENIIKENKIYRMARNVGIPYKRNPSLLDLEMKLIYFKILDIIGEYYSTYINENLTAFEPEILEHVKFICQSLINNSNKLSEQLQSDINNELMRMSSLIQLGQVVNHQTYVLCNKELGVVTALNAAKKVILSWYVFDSKLAAQLIENLQDTLKQSSKVVTQKERAMIVKAMDMTAGHWFKCPNGHIYCIGECGGAMQVSKCNECGAPVGGTHHQLLSSNSHAGEMDGSQYPAWSEQNNMANYQVNF
ncbi:NFX1-type zinc finger-containing protein 1-like [Plodia interpunctella]|uniref:NFX1-type zinc finger-containing protein 1-like n=1 Tax=Plodia interpunctella TaxID=58824 RepID=UPI002368095D|nr:NFX1-type zinc finger-containing protein 1-like [Plodia interpunctella]XP_053609182.1 NFX1-type zinc finger-containing protein 1-like [Plodia interpunctella]